MELQTAGCEAAVLLVVSSSSLCAPESSDAALLERRRRVKCVKMLRIKNALESWRRKKSRTRSQDELKSFKPSESKIIHVLSVSVSIIQRHVCGFSSLQFL